MVCFPSYLVLPFSARDDTNSDCPSRKNCIGAACRTRSKDRWMDGWTILVDCVIRKNLICLPVYPMSQMRVSHLPPMFQFRRKCLIRKRRRRTTASWQPIKLRDTTIERKRKRWYPTQTLRHAPRGVLVQ